MEALLCGRSFSYFSSALAQAFLPTTMTADLYDTLRQPMGSRARKIVCLWIGRGMRDGH